jgi:hypothetical protein
MGQNEEKKGVLPSSPAAKAYGMGVTVTKSGFTEGRGECNVPIQ